ncbi:MAG: radical SAM protein [Dorea sp.]|jgi:Predicted Fe-S oxidoreductases|nr:radical SAM protein [Dorea sp.]
MNGGYIPINKGNYDMDTDERIEQFELNRAEGWEEDYRKYRENWSKYPRQQYVSDYPILVDIELSSLCNLKCPMCYTITEEFKKKVCTQLMDTKLFQKLADEMAGKVSAVRLSLRGEATLHPDFISCIRYCKDKGIREVSFLTNSAKLNREYFIQAAEAGADWITISIDGVGKQYEDIRKPLKFEDTLKKIKDIYSIKKKNKWNKPVIKVQGIWPAIRDNPSEYYNTFAPYVDLVAFNPLIDYLDKDEDIVYDEDFICPQLYQRLVIGSDGKALLCSNDEEGNYILGDANNESIYDIWHGERMNRARKLHAMGSFKEMEVCRKCYLPRATQDDERAFVNGREIIIKNYINRNQTIGK